MNKLASWQYVRAQTRTGWIPPMNRPSGRPKSRLLKVEGFNDAAFFVTVGTATRRDAPSLKRPLTTDDLFNLFECEARHLF